MKGKHNIFHYIFTAIYKFIQGMISSFGRGSAFHIGAAFSGENVGLRETEPGRWLINFMDLDLGYVDQKTRDFESMI